MAKNTQNPQKNSSIQLGAEVSFFTDKKTLKKGVIFYSGSLSLELCNGKKLRQFAHFLCSKWPRAPKLAKTVPNQMDT